MSSKFPEELEQLLAAPMLWPSDLRKLYILAHRHGVEVCILRRDLNDWAAGWREVDRIGNLVGLRGDNTPPADVSVAEQDTLRATE